jgi:pyruvate/2-oxoglutarate/acetoin dehydrogenase E1 component
MKLTGRGAINKALFKALEDPKVLLIGEDIAEEGCFYCEKGLRERYPDQIISTPISEAGFTGLATGLCLAGYKPIVTYMFMDFSLLAADQIINHALLFNKLYKSLPILYRTTVGAGFDYGPTHSQNHENLFGQYMPVIHPKTVSEYYSSFVNTVVNLSGPTMFIEEKMLYGEVGEIDGF